MDALSDASPVQRVVVVKSTQVGLTEVGLNWIGYHIHRQLGPMLVVVPTLDVRKKWVLQRLHPMLQDTECLRALNNQRKRDSANSEDIKDYPGALVVLSGANSPSSLASMPIKHVICDEVDRFPWEAGDEGDPLGLIQRRTSNFPRRKVLLISSPTVKDASRIDDEFQRSDQRRYQVPCPECGTYQPLVWKNLQWSSDLSAVYYVCADCGCSIDEHHKTRMLAAGRWVATHPERKVRGYHINGLYAPIGLGLSWRELVDDWLDTKNDITKLKRFINTALGEVWEDDRTKDLTPHSIKDRAEPYPLRVIPPGCLLLTAGVDTQDDYLAVQVVGHGAEGRRWVIDWFELPGSPGRAEVWDKLTDYLAAPIENGFGVSMYIEATAIDTGGHYTHEVYQYVRSARIRRPMAIKGASKPGSPILPGRPRMMDVRASGRVIRAGVKLWGLELDYYQQLIAETFDPEKNKWLLRKGRRNEALDTHVYALAAGHHAELRAHAKRPADWARLAQMLQPEDRPDTATPTPSPARPQDQAAPTPTRKQRLIR